MLPTFHDQQMWYGDPCNDKICRNSIERGDIVVFDTKNVMGKDDIFIKRVIGIPLDHITIANGQVYVNDYLWTEPYVSTPTATNTLNDCQSYHLESDQIFVLGDNRPRSNDSRIFGPVDIAEIWGISHFEEYNSIEEHPKIDLTVKLQVNEAECPVWTKY